MILPTYVSSFEYVPYAFLFSSFIKRSQELLDENGSEYVKTRDSSGHTLLHWAALGGSTELVEVLLQRGALLDVHSDNDYGPRPIHWACVHGHVTVLDQFLEKGVSIETLDYNRCTPLLIAAQYGQSLVISYLLKKGANKDHVDINKDTALHWASYKGRYCGNMYTCYAIPLTITAHTFTLLPSDMDRYMCTHTCMQTHTFHYTHCTDLLMPPPLLSPLWLGHPEAVLILLSWGLDPKQKDAYQQTPVHSCSINGDVQCMEMLLDHVRVM